MKLTQINFDCIEADGKKWVAVISHTGGVPTLRSLRGKRATPKFTAPKRKIMNAPRVEMLSRIDSPGSLPLASRTKAVPYAKYIN
jgi:hypothetical protein